MGPPARETPSHTTSVCPNGSCPGREALYVKATSIDTPVSVRMYGMSRSWRAVLLELN